MTCLRPLATRAILSGSLVGCSASFLWVRPNMVPTRCASPQPVPDPGLGITYDVWVTPHDALGSSLEEYRVCPPPGCDDVSGGIRRDASHPAASDDGGPSPADDDEPRLEAGACSWSLPSSSGLGTWTDEPRGLIARRQMWPWSASSCCGTSPSLSPSSFSRFLPPSSATPPDAADADEESSPAGTRRASDPSG